MKADASHLHKVIDAMYAEFVKAEKKNSEDTTARAINRHRHQWIRCIMASSLAVLLLVSIAIATFFVVPLMHSTPTTSSPISPDVPTLPLAPSIPTEVPADPPLFPASMDQDVLVELYHAAGGKNWSLPINSPNISVCEWPYVTCNDNLRVVALNFKEAGLVGTLPNSIGRLDKLKILYISGTGLRGTIPASLGNLTNLVRLSLVGLSVTGTVPLELFSLTSLIDLDLSNNAYLSWTMPPQIANLENLEKCGARHSGLYGTIPNEISQMTRLKALDLSYNTLTGIVPSLANTSISMLNLANNLLTGSVPKLNEIFLANSHIWLSVTLTNNSFCGEFYLPLGYYTYIDIINNQFTSVSATLDHKLTDSLSCYAQGNPFKCPIPEDFKKRCQTTCI